MKAAVYRKYGPPEVLHIEDVKKPIPGKKEVLIKIIAATVSSGDARLRGFNVPFPLRIPFRVMMGISGPRNKILGFDLSGTIESVGDKVVKFKTGDNVFGSTGFDGGTYAEYTCLSEDEVITTVPDNIALQDASAIFFGGHTALHFLRKGNITRGQNVLIIGASGCLGTYAVQLARYFETEVTGVCSTPNIDLVKSLGADYVIDYTKEDFTKKEKKYDIIFDTTGKSNFSGCVKSLKDKGCYLRAVHLRVSSVLKGVWTNITTNKKVIGGVADEKLEDLLFLKKLVEEEKLKPVIDKYYPLDDIVEAHSYVDSGHKKGSVVIRIN